MSSQWLHLIDGDGEIATPINVARYLATSLGANPRTLPRASDAANLDDSGARGRVLSVPVLKERGCDYRVVGVFGGQSSGKSTLLNHLFGTDFQVMNEALGRQQTTQGCFLSKAKCPEASTSSSGEGLFVMDFEGTDGAERGENQNFEKQLSLFALSVADTLVINMWTNEVGRFNAANLSLLQTVFEVDLQLSAHEDRRSLDDSRKPTLLFVLRDHIDEPLSKLSDIVTNSLHSIFDKISIPSCFAGKRVTDFFNLRFAALPHFKLQRNDFNEAVKDLRRWFLDENHQKYLYSHIRDGNFRGIPLDGLSTYLDSCWETIKANKDLDIPSQREMLARLRCGELAQQAQEEHQAAMDEAAAGIKEGRLIRNITRWVKEAIAARLDDYDNETKHYASKVVQQQRQDLERELRKASDVVVVAQCDKVADRLIKTSDNDVQRVIDLALHSALPRLAREWYGKAEAARNDALQKAKKNGDSLDSALAQARDAQAAVGKVDRAVTKFWQFVSSEIMEVTTKLQDKLTNGSSGDQQQHVDPTAEVDGDVAASDAASSRADTTGANSPASPTLAPASRTMSGAALTKGSRFQSFSQQQSDPFHCLRGDAECAQRALEQLSRGMQTRVHARLSAMTTDASSAMLKQFERMLATNDDGTTRFVSTMKGLDREFGPARASGLLFLACVSMNRLRVSSNGSGNSEVALTPRGDELALRRSRIDALLERWQREEGHLQFGVDDNPRTLFSQPTVAPLPEIPDSAAADAESVEAAALHALENLVLLEPAAVSRAYELYEMKTEFAYKSERQRIESGTQSIPTWVYGLIIFLGANEIYWLLTNPLLLIFALFVTWFFFSNFVTAQWHKFEETGPATIVGPVKIAIAYGDQAYRQHVAPLLAGPPRAAEMGRKKTD